MKFQKYREGNPTGNTVADKFTKALCIIYIIALFWIILFKLGVHFYYMENRTVNLIPFGDSYTSNGKMDVSEIILNVVIFVPLGIYAGVLCKKRTLGKKLLFFFLISFMFEGLQYILRIGAFDITDIITNISGGIMGLLIFEAIEKIFRNSLQSQKFINIAAATGTVLFIALLLLLKLNMLPIRYQ
jgi:glycopeptide antibiotics resistance protein